MKRKLYLILVIILMIASCKEAPYEPELYGGLEGIVLDSETNAALESVSITTNPPTSAVQTEANGHFKIENIPTGTYTLTAKKHGYSKENIGVSVTENKVTNADIFMSLSDSENTPPEKPVVIAPADASKDLPVSIDFIWSAYDIDENDSLNYDVYLYESNSTIRKKIAEGLTDTLLSVGDLKYSTYYYWYVVANDAQLESTVGDVWSFSTEALPDNPIIYSRYSEDGYDIYSTDSEGLTSIKISSLPGDEKWPRFSPNKRYIAFTAKGNMTNNIYIFDAITQNGFFLTDIAVGGNHNPGIGFCWSSNGGKIYFPYYDKLISVNNDGSGLSEVATAPPGRTFRECDYSPIENKLVVLTVGTNIYDNEIYLLDLNDKSLTMLVDNEPGIIERPSYSVDGKKIVYTHDISGYENFSGRQLDSRIFLLDLNDNSTKDISLNKTAGTNDLNPRFSANGAEIIFNNSSNDNSDQSEVWIMDLDGRNRRKILDNGVMPDWK